MKSNNDKEIYELLKEAWSKEFTGWDFSFFKNRVVMDPLSWDYQSIIESYLSKEISLLDMGTGGGEFLSELNPLPKFTHATEAYPPNYAIALKRLEPLGVKVHKVEEDGLLPFKDNQFNLVINRHEFYLPSEVYRILKPNSLFITQQVGGYNDNDINKFLRAEIDLTYKDWVVQNAADDLKKAGFKITEIKEEFPMQRFYDIEALVYYLKAVPWQVEDFSVDKYFDKLKEIAEIIEKEGFFEVLNHRFFIITRKQLK